MSDRTQSIIFEDGQRPLRHIDPGMIQAILHMHYMPQVTVEGGYMFISYPTDKNGEGEVHIANNGTNTKVASIVNDNDVIETIKEVKNLGNSIAVALTNECKMLGISPGDKVRIRIEKVE